MWVKLRGVFLCQQRWPADKRMLTVSYTHYMFKNNLKKRFNKQFNIQFCYQSTTVLASVSDNKAISFIRCTLWIRRDIRYVVHDIWVFENFKFSAKFYLSSIFHFSDCFAAVCLTFTVHFSYLFPTYLQDRTPPHSHNTALKQQIRVLWCTIYKESIRYAYLHIEGWKQYENI